MTATTRPTTRASAVEGFRPWWLWIVTALAFPPAGYIAHEVVGRVDGVGAALLSGVITGALIGLAQWALLRGRGASPRWIVATAAGFGIGLAAGAALVGYETSLGAWSGWAPCAGSSLASPRWRASLRCVATLPAWTFATGALWAIGWAVTTIGAGIKVEDQWPVFGISGALVVVLVQSVLINRFVPAVRSPTASWPTVGNDLHVVFGSGPAGRAVATELEHQGLPTRIVNRSGRPVLADVETIRRRRHRPAVRSHRGARCAHRVLLPQGTALPPLAPGVPTAAGRGRRRRQRAVGARLVVLETSMYGPTGGAPMTESTPVNPTSEKERGPDDECPTN